MEPTRAPFATVGGGGGAAPLARFPTSTTTALPPPHTTTHHASAGQSRAPISTAGKPSSKTRGIELGGWSIQVTSGNIGSSAEMDALSDLLGIPPPEMAFPHNALVLHHHASGFRLCFDAVRALQSVEGVKAENALEGIDCSDASTVAAAAPSGRRKGMMGEKPAAKGKAKGAGGIKVSYAQEWGKKRNEQQQQEVAAAAAAAAAAATGVAETRPEAAAGTEQGEASASTSNFGPEVARAAASNGIASAKEYDWTYSSTWAGAEGCDRPPALLYPAEERAERQKAGSTPSRFVPGTDPSTDRIPVERLGPSSGEPILFYEDIVLYEDELADNGSSMINVKVRVMPSGFLVLQRFFLRVDDVLFRVFDTRLYCQFTETAPSVAARSSRGPGELDMAQMSLASDAPARASEASSTTDVDMDEGNGPPKQPRADATKWPRLIRECSGSEASYAEVKSCLPPYKPHDLSPLTDPNWVANSLQLISRRRFQEQQASLASGQTPRIPSWQFPTTGHSGSSASAAGAGSGVGTTPSLAYLSTGSVPSSRLTGFAGTRPGERLDLSPARAPVPAPVGSHGGGGSAPAEANRIVAELDDDTAVSLQRHADAANTHEGVGWQGIGARVDVALLEF